MRPIACSSAGVLCKVGKTHSVCSVGDHNLGVFTIADIVLKNANAVPPTYFFSEAPNTAYVAL